MLTYFCRPPFVDRYILTTMVEPIKAHLEIGDFEMGLILEPALRLELGLAGISLDGSSRPHEFFRPVAGVDRSCRKSEPYARARINE